MKHTDVEEGDIVRFKIKHATKGTITRRGLINKIMDYGDRGWRASVYDGRVINHIPVENIIEIVIKKGE